MNSNYDKINKVILTINLGISTVYLYCIFSQLDERLVLFSILFIIVLYNIIITTILLVALTGTDSNLKIKPRIWYLRLFDLPLRAAQWFTWALKTLVTPYIFKLRSLSNKTLDLESVTYDSVGNRHKIHFFNTDNLQGLEFFVALLNYLQKVEEVTGLDKKIVYVSVYNDEVDHKLFLHKIIVLTKEVTLL